MLDILYSIDKALFYFGNQTIANPVFDILMPFLTDLNKSWFGLSIYASLWILLMWKGGKKGRIIGLLLIPLIFLSDQLSSSVVKKIVARSRPCHEINGIPIIENIRLLVDCGSGYSFPSSHAVNNFAVATIFAYYYRKWMWWFLAYASIIGYSRISVGVHYPSDVVGGAILGGLCGAMIIILWSLVEKYFPRLGISQHLTESAKS